MINTRNLLLLFPKIGVRYTHTMRGGFVNIVRHSLPNALSVFPLQEDNEVVAVLRSYNNASFNIINFKFRDEGFADVSFIAPRPIPNMVKPTPRLFSYMPESIQRLWYIAFGKTTEVKALVVLANYILSYDTFIQYKDSLNQFLDIEHHQLYDCEVIINAFGHDYFDRLNYTLQRCWESNLSCGSLNDPTATLEPKHIVFKDEVDTKKLQYIDSELRDTLINAVDVPSAVETLFTVMAMVQDNDNRRNDVQEISYGFTSLSLYAYIYDYCPFAMNNKETMSILQQLFCYLKSGNIECDYFLDRKSSRWFMCYFPKGMESTPILELSQLATFVYGTLYNEEGRTGSVYKDIFSEILGVVLHDYHPTVKNIYPNIRLGYMGTWQLAYYLPCCSKSYRVTSRLVACGLLHNFGETVGLGEIDEHPYLYKFPKLNLKAKAEIQLKVLEAYHKWEHSGYRYTYSYPPLNLYFKDKFNYVIIKNAYVEFLTTSIRVIKSICDRKGEYKRFIMNSEENHSLFRANRRLQPFVISMHVDDDDYFRYLQSTDDKLFKIKLFTTRAQVILNLLLVLYYASNLKLAKSYMDILSPFLKQHDVDLQIISDHILNNNFNDTNEEDLFDLIWRYIDILLSNNE